MDYICKIFLDFFTILYYNYSTTSIIYKGDVFMCTDENSITFIRELLKGYNIKLDSSDAKVYLYLALFDKEHNKEQTRQSSIDIQDLSKVIELGINGNEKDYLLELEKLSDSDKYLVSDIVGVSNVLSSNNCGSLDDLDTGFGSECFETDEFSSNKSYQKAEVEELKFTNTALDLLAKKALDAMLIDKTGRLSDEIKVHFQQGYSEIHNNISDFVVWLKVLSGDLS